MDFTLTDEQLRWRAVARDFSGQVIQPDVLRRDRLPTAAERIPWDWIRQADKLGLRTLGVPKAWGGAGAEIVTLCLVVGTAPGPGFALSWTSAVRWALLARR